MHTTSGCLDDADDALHERLRACDHVLRGSYRLGLRACRAASHSQWDCAIALYCTRSRSRLQPAGHHQASRASAAECTRSSTTCASARSSRCSAGKSSAMCNGNRSKECGFPFVLAVSRVSRVSSSEPPALLASEACVPQCTGFTDSSRECHAWALHMAEELPLRIVRRCPHVCHTG